MSQTIHEFRHCRNIMEEKPGLQKLVGKINEHDPFSLVLCQARYKKKTEMISCVNKVEHEGKSALPL